MDAERWRQVRPILESALDLSPGTRKDFLDAACGDATLRREVESLLLAHDRAATEALNPESEMRFRLPTGKRIGPYEILEEIATGGMGAVYHAVRADGQYQQHVALKIMRAELGSTFTAARFRNERQILASLDHPNIGKILDGGTTSDGLPYFVMELIEGRPVTEYCDSRKLSIEERLEIFRTICMAVHSAHQRLVIHRDIKPGNVLVTTLGAPKLLDFGIAKILDPNLLPETAAMTAAGVGMMTPEYASPEQLRGEPITTATDIYSLGLVLFELLTGRRPYRFPSRMPHEIARIVLQTEPEKPSVAVGHHDESVGGLPGIPRERLSHRLAGDLDNIVMKALRREPEQRYPSAEQFAEDIRRHLENLPVLARNDAVAYRAAKFIQRHKLGVATASLIALLLLSGIAVTLHEASMARSERRVAEQRFIDLRELARSNLFEVTDALAKLPGSAEARNLVIQRALRYLDKLSRDSAGDRGLMRELAAGYERIASLQGNFGGPGIGDTQAALDSYQKALTIRDALVAGSNKSAEELQPEVVTLRYYVRGLIETGRIEDASRMAQRGLAASELLVRKRPEDRDALVRIEQAHILLASVKGGDGSSASSRELPEAIAQDREAIRLLESELAKRLALNPRELILARNVLAFHLSKQRQFDESLRIFGELSVAADELQLTDMVRYNVHQCRAIALDRAGDFRRALEERRKNLAVSGAARAADPHDLRFQIAFAAAEGSVAIEEARIGNQVAAKREIEDAIAIGERLLAADPQHLFYKNLLLIGYAYQAEILNLMGDPAGAQKRFTQALEAAAELVRHDPHDLESRLSIAKLHFASGVVLARMTRYPEARQAFAAASNDLDQLLQIRPQDTEALYVSTATRNGLAGLQDCSAGRECPGFLRISLPNFNN
jgi:non-specific serine/threonine protein kinase/serine/threonine-protein kinase